MLIVQIFRNLLLVLFQLARRTITDLLGYGHTMDSIPHSFTGAYRCHWTQYILLILIIYTVSIVFVAWNPNIWQDLSLLRYI